MMIHYVMCAHQTDCITKVDPLKFVGNCFSFFGLQKSSLNGVIMYLRPLDKHCICQSVYLISFSFVMLEANSKDLSGRRAFL